MDLITIPQDKVEKAQSHAQKCLTTANELAITSAENFSTAQATVINVVKARKQVEEFISGLVKPFKLAVKESEAKLKPLLAPYEQAEEIMRSKLNAYIAQQNALAQQAAEKERTERAAENAKRISEAAKNNVAPILVEPEPIEKPTFQAKTQEGGFHTVKRWTYKEIDMSKVPERYITRTLNSKEVNAAIKFGVRAIEGLEIFEEETSVIRT